MKKIINDIKSNKIVLFYSLIEGFLLIYGILLQDNKGLSKYNLICFISTIFITIIFYILNRLYFKILDFKYKEKDKYKYSKKMFFIFWILIFMLWIPVLLAYYPSVWSYDVYNQVPHILGLKITTQHPIVHTLFIELILGLGNLIKNYTFGILLLTIVQMIIMSLIFGYSIEKIRTKIDNKVIRIIISFLLIIYYGLLPFNSIMSISITKDVLFSGLLLLLIIYIYDFIDGENISKSKYILFMIVSILFMLIKNNSVIIYSIFTIFLIIFYKEKLKKNMIILCIISIITSLVINYSLIFISNAQKYSKFERYNIEIQNLVYVAIKHPEINENNDNIYDIIPKKCFDYNLTDNFDNNRVDYAKDKLINCNLNNFDYNKFNKTWIKYGLKYPIDYIDSWSNITIGSWFLFDESHANTYPGNNQGYLLTDYKAIKGVSDELPDSKFPWLFNKMEKIATENKQYDSVGIWRFIYAPATYILSFFLLISYIVSRKLKNELIPLVLLIGVYITLLNAPVIIVRYIYPFMVCAPIIFVRLFTRKEKLN